MTKRLSKSGIWSRGGVIRACFRSWNASSASVGHGALVLPSEPVGAVVWPEVPPRPPPPLLFLPLLPPPLPLLWFLLLYLFRLPPVPPFPPLGGRDDVEDSGLAVGDAALV
jgi:hypothetical protein